MSQKKWFAMAAIGRDRPGIVADLSECIYACGCNLEDASMTMLGSEFATLMLVSGSAPDVQERLHDACKHLEWERRLTVFLRPVEASEAPETAPEAELVAVGIDRAGIVAGVSRVLADHGVLIVDLRGEVQPVAESGTPLYTLRIRARLAATVAISQLRDHLDRKAAELGVDIDLRPLPSA